MSNCDHTQAGTQAAQRLSQQLAAFLGPLLVELDARLDKRLVRTFFATLQAIVQLRHRHYGLLLSELDGYILSPEQAPAGTKRLSNLLRCQRWTYGVLEHYLWRRATQRVQELGGTQEVALAVWDESVLERSESIALEGLCAVRSSKARRLKRVKPGYYNPPGGDPSLYRACTGSASWC